MHRRLNVKLALGTVLGLALFGGGLHWLHGFQVRRHAGLLLRQADRAEAEGPPRLAADYLGRYLALAPGDTDALARYGLTLEGLAKTPKQHLQAFLVLDQVLRREPGRHDLRRRVARLAINLEQFSDAIEHLKTLLKACPDDGELEHLYGWCLEANGDFRGAADAYARAVARAPGQVESYVRLAFVRRQHGRDGRAAADRAVDDLVAANPEAPKAWLARSHYFRAFAAREKDPRARQEMFDRAEQAAAAARGLAPDDADVLLEGAGLARDLGRLGDGRDLLRRAVARHPRDARLYKALADLEYQAGRPREAVACVGDGLKALPGHGDLLWALANLVLHGGDVDEARDILARLRAGDYPQPLRDCLEARILLREEKWREARRLLEQVHPLLQPWPDVMAQAHLLLGLCYERLGDADRQYAAYRRAAGLDPRAEAAFRGMGQALLALDRLDEAIDAYRQVPGARLVLAHLLILHNLRRPEAQRDWREVEQILDGAADRLPEVVAGLAARAVLARGDAAAVLAASRVGRAATPEPVELTLLRADLLAARQGKDWPRQVHDLLAAARDARLDRPEPWAALALLAQRQKKWDEALALLDEAEARCGGRPELLLARAHCWAERGGPAAPAKLLGLARAAEALPDRDRRRVLQAAADALARLGDVQEAERLYARLADLQPADVGVRLALFDLALQAGDEAALRRAADDLRAIEGDDGSLWRYCKARLLIWKAGRGDKGRLDEASALLAAVAERRPRWHRVLRCQGQVSELRGNPDAAIATYKAAIDQGERGPSVVRRTVELLCERRRYAEAEQVLQKLQDQALLLGDLGRVGAELALRKKDFGLALSLAERAVAKSQDYRDHVWLGQVLWAADRRADAEPAFRRAVALNEQAPEAWLALVHCLAATGQAAKAEAAVRDAEAKLPGDAAGLALARCHELTGRPERARELYRAALAKRPDDVAALRGIALFCLRTSQPAEARVHLEKLQGLRDRHPEDAAWARRTLALVLAAAGDPLQARHALELLGLADDARPDPAGESVEDLRAKAQVLAAQKNRRPRLQAIALLENLLKREPATPDDRLLLARLYDAVGDWRKAREQVGQLLAERGERPAYLALYVQSLLRKKELAEAGAWLAKLEAVEPGSFRTLELRCRLLKEQGQAAEAVAPLRAFAEDKPDYLRPAAVLLEELGQIDAAREEFRRFAERSGRPEDRLTLAEFLGRHGGLDEALGLCERAWPDVAPEAAAGACVAVLYAAGAGDGPCRRVAGRIEEAVKRHPDKLALLTHLAAVRRLQGQYAEAEELYRRTLAKEPDDALTLNNLAWLLAVRDGKAAEALPLAQRAIRLAGPDPDFLDTRAAARLRLGQAAQAVEDLKEAVADAPAAPLYFHLAQAHEAAGQRGEAAQAFRQAQQFGLHEGLLEPFEREPYRQLSKQLGGKRD